jgi:hypothetical protein
VVLSSLRSIPLGGCGGVSIERIQEGQGLPGVSEGGVRCQVSSSLTSQTLSAQRRVPSCRDFRCELQAGGGIRREGGAQPTLGMRFSLRSTAPFARPKLVTGVGRPGS